MRIISGIHKGRKLHPPPANSKSIRPTSDKAREALFNILGARIKGSCFLDLFAGTGAVGLEAFSREAKEVTFIDNNSLALQILRKNISLFMATDPETTPALSILKADLSKKLPLKRILAGRSTPYDIIFADPPYDAKHSLRILEAISKSPILASEGTVIIEERKNAALPHKIGNLVLTDQRGYGENGFWLYRRSQ